MFAAFGHLAERVVSRGWLGTVYDGLPLDLYQGRKEPGDYLVFLGRVPVEKRLDRAIEIAKCAGMPLKVAAKVDSSDCKYFALKWGYLRNPHGVYVWANMTRLRYLISPRRTPSARRFGYIFQSF